MIGKKLIADLGIDRKRLNEWIDLGVPFTRHPRTGRPEFDPAAVLGWLEKQGLLADDLLGNRNEVANHFGVGLRTVANWLADGCPGSKDYYDPEKIQAWLDQRDAARSPARQASPTDPLLSGSSSPALERYRTARAELAELEVAQKRGDLVSVSDVNDLLLLYGKTLRGAMEQIARRGDAASLEILNASCNAFDRELAARLKPPGE